MAIAFHGPAPVSGHVTDRLGRALLEIRERGVWRDGPEVEALERELAAWLGTAHAVGLSSGTDALLVALMSLGVGPGDEVVVPAFGSLRLATTVVRCGARPVFADLDPVSFALDPARVEAAITGRTRAISVQHLYGRTGGLDELAHLAAQRKIPLIEDASQALGAEEAGRRAGTFGRLGCFSFSPGASPLGAWGEAGALVTDDAALAEHARSLRAHGLSRRYVATRIGGNFRLDEVQAAVLRIQLPEVEGWIAARQDLAYRYQDHFGRAPSAVAVGLPDPGLGRATYSRYVVRIGGGRRAEVFDALGEAQIGREVAYPLALHQQPCLERLGYPAGAFPQAERAAAEVLGLPIWLGLLESQQAEVVRTITEQLTR
jgi:dTDP-4-amino-4,6-dideoxygalactose transaminase